MNWSDMDRGPKAERAHFQGDLVVVWLTGILTAAEQYLDMTLSNEKGRDLRNRAGNHLIEIA